MNKKIRGIFAIVLMVCLTIGLMSCGELTTLEKLQEENKDWLVAVDDVTLGGNLVLQDDLTWGMSRGDTLKNISGELEENFETYVGTWITSALPTDNKWKTKGGNLNKDAFKKAELKSYYVFLEGDSTLVEYGYQYYSPNLEQYDFLKEYYTKKYGTPQKEEFIWNDENYKPTGKENLYQMFEKGQVKVLTAWDIEELDSVLVVDWLNDPVKVKNNYGQISFMQRTGDLNTEDEE